MLTNYDEVAKDTRSVVRAILKILLEDGHDPSKDYYFIVTHAYQPAGTGETGKPLTRKSRAMTGRAIRSSTAIRLNTRYQPKLAEFYQRRPAAMGRFR